MSDIRQDDASLSSKRESTNSSTWSKRDERRLFSKINYIVLPYVILSMFLQQADKLSLNFASILGIYADTGITHSEFGMLGSALYIAQLTVELPVVYLLQAFPVSKILGGSLVIWAIFMCTAAFAKNYSQLLVYRIFMGLSEAPIYPAVFLLIKTQYRRSEQSLCLGIAYASLSLGSFFAGLLSYGIGHATHVGTFSGWQWCFLFWGLFTLCTSILMLIFVPDTPYSRWFRLSPIEKRIIDDRVCDNAVVQNKEIHWNHILEALKEPRYYCHVLISLFCSIPNGCIVVFGSQIVHNMGYAALESILLTGASGVVHAFVSIVFFYFLYKTPCRNYIAYTSMAFATITSLFGMLLLAFIAADEPSVLRLFGFYLAMTITFNIGNQTLISNNVSGSTKMNFYSTSIMMANTAGHFIGPLLMFEREAPQYTSATAGCILVEFVCIILFFYIGWSLGKARSRKLLLLTNGGTQHREGVPTEDLTDVEDKNFIYKQ
ncbi:major facilitator superfamily domain-containing protein [Fennellomyces sp. T-0311]|nr:major facilitator superfamily domain-containing protein [Fennellomyces sp. T-0311]